jgi:hypothetical protein
MSKEVVAILQNSLTENERIRKRQLAGFAFALLAMLSVVLDWPPRGSSRHAHSDDAGGTVIAMVVAVCDGVLALALYINRVTARLLKTLTLISRES